MDDRPLLAASGLAASHTMSAYPATTPSEMPELPRLYWPARPMWPVLLSFCAAFCSPAKADYCTYVPQVEARAIDEYGTTVRLWRSGEWSPNAKTNLVLIVTPTDYAAYVDSDRYRGLCKKHIAVAQFNSIGVVRKEHCAVGEVQSDDPGFGGWRCIDKQLAAQDSPQLRAGQIASVSRFLRTVPEVGNAKVGVFAVSDWVARTAQSVAENHANLDFIVGVGMVLGSHKDRLSWLAEGRYLEAWSAADVDHDGVVTTEEWQRAETLGLFDFAGPGSQWLRQHPGTRAELLTFISRAKEAYAAEADRYSRGAVQAASVTRPEFREPVPTTDAFTRDWFTNSRPNWRFLADWRGTLELIYGERDCIVSAEVSRKELEVARSELKGHAELHVVPGVGHNLGNGCGRTAFSEEGDDAVLSALARIQQRDIGEGSDVKEGALQ